MRPRNNGRRRGVADLGRLEAAVMDRLWSWDRPVVVREVLEDLQRERDIAYTTVMTVMDNLHKKGMLLRQRNGRAFVYRPTRSRAAHTAELMEEALSRSADRGTALMRFVEQLPADELIELRRLIDSVADDSASGKSG
jgi:predicted transcriptional regulator